MNKNAHEERRNSLLARAFQEESKILEIQDSIKDLLQQAVDMDLQRLGYVDQITLDTLDSFGMEKDSVSRYIYPKGYLTGDTGPEMVKARPEPEPVKAEPEPEPAYVTYASVDGKETVMEGDDLGELLEKWKLLDAGRDSMQSIGHVFVIDNRHDGSAKTRRYEIATGMDVTPIYLKLPEMSGDDTERVKQWLRENGAEYNEKKNLWYITGAQDKDRFTESFRQYIKGSHKKPEKGSAETKLYSYMYDRDGNISHFTGDSMGEVMAHWQKLASERGKNNAAEYFYVREKNAATGRLGEASRHETTTGRDVTPVYLNLPPMSKSCFAKTTLYLKENGAKFNAAKKAWYVTRDQDPARFEQFLQKPEARESTVRKLADGKREAAQARSKPSGEREPGAAR